MRKPLLIVGVAVLALLVGVGIGVGVGMTVKDDHSSELAKVRADLRNARQDARAQAAAATSTTASTSTTTTTTTTVPPPPPTNPPTMSLAEFNAIQNGWSLQQVIDTVGGPGQLQSTSDFDGQHLEGYMWNGQSSLGFASASVFFRNGQVYQKLQFNLQ